MSEDPKFVDGFLSELKATLSDEDGEIILRRINTERLIRKVVEEFEEIRADESIRILSDTSLTSGSGSDILVQVDDYDIRIQIVDAPNDKPNIDIHHLNQFNEILNNNPSTIALVVVWTTDDLLSIAFSMPALSRLIDKPDLVEGELAKAEPLINVLGQVVNSQSKLWDATLDTISEKPSEKMDAQSQFISEFKEAVVVECNRSYRSVFRKQAAEDYRTSDETRIIMHCLQEALEGANAEDLLRQLTKIGARGD